ncbi:thioredoxin family protein [Oscillibacter ruminantium]|jgi:small redox-active disulfide protein 2|uniref:thioredoxin family protein n=1 Tax=Oscillibacter ruminantium TaxID=1263547 RepID=UPI00030316D6|nr:thioredoxin family protein [Oscillibacter ruminantium]
MALFGFGKKKNAEEELVQCGCGEMCKPSEIAAKKADEEAKVSGSSVKVLGSGCAKCNQLEAATLEALKELGMDATIDHVTDFTQIAAYGVMTTPALVVDGKVVSFGKVLKKDEVVKILQKVRG